MKKIMIPTLLLALPLGTQCFADQVIPDDLIVTQSACIGTNCIDGEDFGEATLLLKGNILQLEFTDTSAAGGFPTNDWKIIINDPDGTGTDNYIAIEDANAGKQVFRIDSGAPAESLVIGSQGNLYLTPSGTGRITNVASPVNLTDAVPYSYVKGLAIAPATISWISTSGTNQASANGTGSTALGEGAIAHSFDTAVGYKSTVTADNSTAIGAYSRIDSPDSVAVGANSAVAANANGGTAIGQNSTVKAGASNSVALGKDSVASEPNTVSVGSPGSERKITNVADGINATDAVNHHQLGQVSSRVSRNKKDIKQNRTFIADNTAAIQQNSASINQLYNEIEDTFAGIAAVASLIPMTPSAPGRTTINVGLANFEGESAIGLSIAHRLQSMLFNDSMFLSSGFSYAGDEILASVGVGWSF
ncbi:YadA C-terminal domain-containing protein [Desulfopila sp. IMCC35008]|uniref:YadA C-terminal domain-containing protein n=1 Tax=Desulfopila sp. IMCC35008 TaxID=2653858 RepID=UPI0013D2C453|nr:YadA-like family protein [Desulfopila sp. IMCC35008]